MGSVHSDLSTDGSGLEANTPGGRCEISRTVPPDAVAATLSTR